MQGSRHVSIPEPAAFHGKLPDSCIADKTRCTQQVESLENEGHEQGAKQLDHHAENRMLQKHRRHRRKCPACAESSEAGDERKRPSAKPYSHLALHTTSHPRKSDRRIRTMFAAPQHAGVAEARAAAPRRDERHRACATSSVERYRARHLAVRQTVLSAKRHRT